MRFGCVPVPRRIPSGSKQKLTTAGSMSIFRPEDVGHSATSASAMMFYSVAYCNKKKKETPTAHVILSFPYSRQYR